MKKNTHYNLFTLILILTALTSACSVGGNARKQSISGRVWLDANADGLQDTGEAGLTGAPIKLLAGGRVIASTITGENGRYEFTGDFEGEYIIEFLSPPGFAYSPIDQGDDSLDSDVIPENGKTNLLILGSGESIINLDAGLIPPGPGTNQ